MYYPVDDMPGFVSSKPGESLTPPDRVTVPVFTDERIREVKNFFDVPFDHHHTLFITDNPYIDDGTYVRAIMRFGRDEQGNLDWDVPTQVWWPSRPDLNFWFNLDADQFREVMRFYDNICEYYSNHTPDYTSEDHHWWCIYE